MAARSATGPPVCSDAAACRPAQYPEITTSATEVLPSRAAPNTPPAHSPAAYSPGTEVRRVSSTASPPQE